MKPTQLTELFANIRATFVSFFSIFMFVALGVGIFLGIAWVAPALQNVADEAFDEGSFHNVQIQYVYGLSDDDLGKLAEVEGVTAVEAGYQSFQTAVIGSESRTVKLQSAGERIDTLTAVEGVLPTKADEVAVIAGAAGNLGIAVGDTITFEKDAEPNGEAGAMNTGGAQGGAADAASTSVGQGAQGTAAQDGGDGRSDVDGMKYLNGASYRVTALVNSPEYVATSSAAYGISPGASGTVGLVAWVPTSAFDAAAFQHGYPLVNVRCESLSRAGTFSDEYAKESSAVVSRIAELGDGLAEARYDDLHGQAQRKVDEAQAQVDDAKQRITDGEGQLADARTELEEKRAEADVRLASAHQQLVDGQAQYDANKATYDEFKGMYDQIVGVIEGNRATIAALSAEATQLEKDRKADTVSEKEYAKRRAEITAQANELLSPIRAFIDDVPVVSEDDFANLLLLALSAIDGYREIPLPINGETMTLNQAEEKLADAKAELDAGYKKLQDGWAAYYDGIEKRDATVADAERRIADGERQLEGAKEQVAGNEPKVDQAKEQVAAMKDYAWTVLGRSGNVGVREIGVLGNVTTNLSFSMALLFVIVGLLVSYSAISRIVHEQVTQIGTKKALGLREREITASFLLYAGMAVLLGAIVGAIMGAIVVEGIIARALRNMFTFGAFPSYFGAPLFLVVTLLELGLVLGATWLACRSILKEHAVELLKGEKPPEAKTRFYEKWGAWSKMSLFTQVIVNNCVNDKRRVFSTVVGVVGCTALIVTAITLNDDVLKSYDRHYEDVYGFNAVAYADSAVAGSADGVEGVFRNAGGEAAQVLRKSFLLTDPSGESTSMRAIVPTDNETFGKVYHVNPVSGSEVDLSQNGAWVSQAYRDHFGAKVGDTLTLDAGDGVVHKVPILGFYEFWLTYHEMVMGRDYYEREFGTTLAPNAVLGQAAFEDGAATLDFSSVAGFDSVVDDKTAQYGNFSTFSSVSSAVVLIYLALSVLMAVVVLLNLNVMFIDEKKRELIVLMINGFSLKDAKRYIYNDTIVLTAIGIVLGVVLGCASGAVTIGAMEPSSAMFVKDVDAVAVVAGVVGSAVLAFVMSVIALRRISQFALTDINKF